jgi:hypothetical protein
VAGLPIIESQGGCEVNTKKLLVDFASVFAVSLGVTAVVTLLWNLLVHHAGAVDWETSLRFAIVLGIILTWMEARRAR